MLHSSSPPFQKLQGPNMICHIFPSSVESSCILVQLSEIAPNFAIYCSVGIVLTDHWTPKQELSFAFLENSDQQGMLFILGFYRLLDWGRQCLVRQTWVIGTKMDIDMNFSWSSWGLHGLGRSPSNVHGCSVFFSTKMDTQVGYASSTTKPVSIYEVML